jgi:hypothetical protein
MASFSQTPPPTVPITSFTPTTIPTVTEPKESFLVKANKWVTNNIRRPTNLKLPGRYDEHDKEAKSVFVSPNELGDGLNIQIARPLAQTSYHDVAVVHGLALGSAMRPPEYNMTFTFSNPRGLLYGQFTSSQVFIANIKQRFLKKRLQAELLFVNANDTFQLKTEYHGNDNVSNAEWHHENGKFTMAYMQAVLKNLDIGTSVFYKTSDRRSGISGAVRYHEEDHVITGELTVRGSSADANEKIFRGTYYERVDTNTVMVAELTCDLTERDARLQYGFQQNFLTGKLRVTADNNFQLKGVFDQAILPNSNFQCTVDADPAKSDFKFGFNIHFG